VSDVVRPDAGTLPERPVRGDAYGGAANLHETRSRGPSAGQSPTPLQSGVVIDGSWAYYLYDGVTLRYSRFVKVELWRQQLVGHTVDGVTWTDVTGAFRFTDVAPGTLALVFYAENPAAVVKDAWWIEYAWWTDWVYVASDWPAHYATFGDDPYRAAFFVLDGILDERLWLGERTGWYRSPVVVYWPAGTWPYSTGDSISLPALQSSACSPEECAWDRQVALHEYGHSVMYAAYGNRFPEGDGPDPHYVFSESSGGFALTEGWAEFMEGAVDNDPYAAGLRLESGYWADYLDADWDGNVVEGAVANVLWDVLDGADLTDFPYWDDSRNGDRIQGEFPKLWYILTTYGPNDLQGIWNAWQTTYGVGPDLWAIFYYGRLWTDSAYPTNPAAFASTPANGTWSNDTTVDVCWLGAFDPVSGVYGFSFAWDQSAGASADETIDTTDVCTSLLASSEGAWYLHVRTRDRAGNWNPETVHFGPLLIDVTPPGQPQVTGPVGWMNDATPTFSWSVPPDLSGISGYSFSVDIPPDDSVDTTSSSVALPGQPEGVHTFYVKARDTAGNWGSVKSYVFMLDFTPPSVTVTSPGDGSLIHVTSVTIVWRGDDALSGIRGYAARLDNGSTVYVGTEASVMFVELPDGWHTVSVEAVDAAGNSRTTSVSFRVDTNIFSPTGPYGPFPLSVAVGALLVGVAIFVLALRRRRRRKVPRPPIS